MLRIRLVEEAIAERYSEQEMRCPMHLCIGQEAVASGVCTTLAPQDIVFSNHRAHGHYLAKGGSLNAMIAELYGRKSGCCGGRGGSMHLIDLSVGFMGATPIVGGTIPLAVGAAWAASLRKTNQLITVFFGDGCFEEGVVHEAMNFAALHSLPIIFVCENNDFSVYTRRRDRQPLREIYPIARAHGLHVDHGDGNNVEVVMEKTDAACNRARNGDGPQFLEFKVFRWREHCGPNYDHDLKYRDEIEISEGIDSCPIKLFGDILKNRKLLDSSIDNVIREEIQQEILIAFNFALESPCPTLQDGMEKVYA